MAEWLCRAVDRINPARVLGPRYCFGRGTPAPDSKIILRLLQLRQNPSVFAQGCADFPPDSSDRNHSFTPDPRRASPSLRPGLSFRYAHPVTTSLVASGIMRIILAFSMKRESPWIWVLLSSAITLLLGTVSLRGQTWV